jgi:hypothetical protein
VKHGPHFAVELCDDLLLVDLIRIIRPSVPITRCFALFALFARDILLELVIPRKAAATLGRSSPLPTEEVRALRSGSGSLQRINSDTVPPVVAHVVDVTHLSHTLGQQRR